MAIIYTKTRNLSAGSAGSLLSVSHLTSHQNLDLEIQDISTALNYAVPLGYAEITADQTGIGSSATDITNLSVTITVPAGGRRVKITGFVRLLSTTATLSYVTIKESSTQLNVDYKNITAALLTTHYPQVILTPSAGSHTYKLTASTDSGTIDVKASATTPNFILVELI